MDEEYFKEKLEKLFYTKSSISICVIGDDKDEISNLMKLLNYSIFGNKCECAAILSSKEQKISYCEFKSKEFEFKNSELNDAYECAYKNLEWDGNNLLLMNIARHRCNSPFSQKLRNGMKVEIFETTWNIVNPILQEYSDKRKSESKKLEKEETDKERMNIKLKKLEDTKHNTVTYDAQVFSCDCKGYEITEKTCKCFKSGADTKVEIAKEPFEAGAEMYCFFGFDKFKAPKVFKKLQLTTLWDEAKMKMCVRIHTAAKNLAKEYTHHTGVKIDVNKLYFIKTYQRNEFCLMDDFLDGEYIKFTNNEYSKFGDHPELEEFSHWSFQYTQKKVMVVDLQGVYDGKNNIYRLTDPAIHSAERIYGETDLGLQGCNRFMLTHRCRNVESKQKTHHNRILVLRTPSQLGKPCAIICKKCSNKLTTSDNFVSDGYFCKAEKASLYKDVRSVHKKESHLENMRSGKHYTQDVSCSNCDEYLGWFYSNDNGETIPEKANHYVLIDSLVARVAHKKQ